MAGLKKINGKWVARIYYTVDGKPKEKRIPLHTKQEARARKKLKLIEEREKLFKAGVRSIDQIASDEVPNNQEYIDKFIEFKQLERNISDNTVELYNLALNELMAIFNPRD